MAQRNSISDNDPALRDVDLVARASLGRYGWLRLGLSRLFEVLFEPLVRLSQMNKTKPGTEPLSILVIEYWFLGDAVMAMPFLRNLRVHYPNAHIAILASPRSAGILEDQGCVDELIPVNVPWAQHLSRRKKYISRHWVEYFKCLAQLRRRHFDIGFTVRADIRDNFLLWVTGVKRRVGYGYAYGASFLTDVVPPEISRPHLTDRWLRFLELLHKPILYRQPELKIATDMRASAKRFLREKGINEKEILIGVHCGARNPVRQWGQDKFLEVAERLVTTFPVKILWFQDPCQSNDVGSSRIIPVTLPLREFLAVLAECKVFLCNDTGPMHMASALDVRVAAVFGPGMKAWWGPRSIGSSVTEHEGVWCRPCFDYCIFDKPYCLEAVSVDSFYRAAERAVYQILVTDPCTMPPVALAANGSRFSDLGAHSSTKE